MCRVVNPALPEHIPVEASLRGGAAVSHEISCTDSLIEHRHIRSCWFGLHSRRHNVRPPVVRVRACASAIRDRVSDGNRGPCRGCGHDVNPRNVVPMVGLLRRLHSGSVTKNTSKGNLWRRHKCTLGFDRTMGTVQCAKPELADFPNLHFFKRPVDRTLQRHCAKLDVGLGHRLCRAGYACLFFQVLWF